MDPQATAQRSSLRGAVASAPGRRSIRWVFYAGLCGLLLLIVSGTLALVMPESMARRVNYNSEAYIFAVVLAGWVQFGAPRVPDHARLRWATMLGVVWAIVGVGLIMSDLPSRIRTLNESALALALLLPYVTLRRPLPRWTLLSVPIMIGMTAWAVFSAPESWIIDQAEAFGFLVLAVLTFDAVDRAILEPGRDSPAGRRWPWYAFMVLEPVIVSWLGTEVRQTGSAISLTLEYLGRIHESFIGILLVVFILRVAPVRPGVPIRT